MEARRSTTVTRRMYNVPAPNSLWHIDGLHCLIRWRIVIHGGIDGYSRRIMYLHASTNNCTAAVLALFQKAVYECGWPRRVRSDKGGQNVDVAHAMISFRGVGLASHIAGSSVHNQRIERLWRDVFRCVCHSLYALFYEMEDSDILNATSDVDLFCLCFVYVPRLNHLLEQFKHGWNNHSLHTQHGCTPLQLWATGIHTAPLESQMSIAEGFRSSAYVIDDSYCGNPFDQGDCFCS